MKRVFSILLATVMAVSMMAVPAFAATTVADAAGLPKYISGDDYWNKEPQELKDAPAMDYVKTIEGVTFSNYIRHTVRDSKDYDKNPIKVYQVYIGIDGAMRSDVDKTEFLLWISKPFNYINPSLSEYHNYTKTPVVNSDLNSIKTNTPYLESAVHSNTPLDWLYEHSIDAYAAKGRNMDGTWDGGLQWVFHKDEDSAGVVSGSYKKAHTIGVRQGETMTYFQVFVTDATNYSGQRADPSAAPAVSDPVTAAPAKEAAALPTKSPIYINNVLTEFEAYNINGNNYFKLRDVALALRGTEKQFEVIWNAAFQTVVDGRSIRGAVDMTSNKGYTPVGGEMARGDGQEKHAVLTTSPILKDGVQVTSVAGYNIGGNNFFKLRDLGELFDFNVSWDGGRGSIIVNTAEGYDPST